MFRGGQVRKMTLVMPIDVIPEVDNTVIVDPDCSVNDIHRIRRFEVNLGTDIAYMEYRFQGGTKVLMRTYVPEKYRGKGNAAKLIQQVLDDLRKAKVQVMVNCAAV